MRAFGAVRRDAGTTFPLRRHNTTMRLRVAEVFASIQGEGILAGTPSVFVRVSGCNLRCSWCDTKYASWRPEGPVREAREVAAEALATGLRHAVLTGGEPMLFEGVVPLAEALREGGCHITVETAGTVWRELPCDLMSISPKLSNSTPGPEAGPGWTARHERRRLCHETVARLLGRYDHQLKFVVDPDAGERDILEVRDWLRRLLPVRPDRVLLMAEGTRAATQLRRQRALARVCLREGWRLSPRLHIDLFGDARGA
jgi:7-carboxy-7-deazaguanine synthase